MKFVLLNIFVAILLAIAAESRAEAVGEPSAEPVAYPDAYAEPGPNPFADPNAEPNADPSADPGILSSMFERGQTLVTQFIKTGFTLPGVITRFIPTPSNIFGLAKHLVFELPQEMVLFAIQSFCK